MPSLRLVSTRDCQSRAERERPAVGGRLGGGSAPRARRSRRRGARSDGGRARARRPGGREHVRRQHGLRSLRLRVHLRRSGRRAPAATAAQPRVRCRRAVPARGRARGDAAAGERAREGVLGRADRDGRAADRVPQPWCPAAGPGAWLGRCERRPRSAGASGAAAGRRRACLVRGHASTGQRGACGGRARAGPPRREGRPVADQRDPVHGGNGRDRARAGTSAGADGRSRVRALARGAAGVADELSSGDPSGEAAARAGRLSRQPAPLARGLGDHRVAPLVRSRPGRLLASVRAAGARGEPRPARRTSRRRSRSS